MEPLGGGPWVGPARGGYRACMPEAWSSKYDRERAREARRRDAEDEGTKAAEAWDEAEDSFRTVTDESRGRRVAD